MKHLVLVLALCIGCATASKPLTTATPDTTDPLAGIMSLLSDLPTKEPTGPCLLNECTFSIHDKVDEDMAKDFTQWMDTVKANHVNIINVSIDSGGGDVDEGFVIIHALEKAEKDGIKSICTVDGTAASMAFAILQSCTYRYMTSRSSLMDHQVRLGEMKHVGETELANALSMLHANNTALANQCAHRMKVTLPEYLAKVDNKEWWMTSDEALAVGAVDKIVKF